METVLKPPLNEAIKAIDALRIESADLEEATLVNARSCLERLGSAEPEVSLGYWRNSVRLVWQVFEVEVWSDHLELYNFKIGAPFVRYYDCEAGQPFPADLQKEVAN